jgi:hypothetical protein
MVSEVELPDKFFCMAVAYAEISWELIPAGPSKVSDDMYQER